MTLETATPLGRPQSPRRVPESKPDVEERSMVNEAVTWTVLGICLVAWTIIGFVLWIPRVLRAMFLFSVALIQATVTDSSAEDAGRRLRRAAEFYTRGFSRAVQGIRSTNEGDENKEGKKTSSGWHIDPGLILRESAWAAVLWYGILWSLGLTVLTPADLVSSITEVPWSRIWSNLVQTVQTIPAVLSGAPGS